MSSYFETKKGDKNRLKVEDVKEFETEHLYRQMPGKLGIEAYFTSLGMSDKQRKEK